MLEFSLFFLFFLLNPLILAQSCYQPGLLLAVSDFNFLTLAPTDLLFVQVDPAINNNWNGGSPNATLAPNLDTFWYGQWTGQFSVNVSQNYNITSDTDDGGQFYINGVLAGSNWPLAGGTNLIASIQMNLTAGVWYDLTFDYFQDRGGSFTNLYFYKGGTNRTPLNVASYRYYACGVYVFPNPIAIAASASNATFYVTLLAQPSTNVNVTLTSGLALSRSYIVFTPSNWNVAVPVLISAPNCAGNYSVEFSTGENVTVTRTVDAGATSISWGDPHYTCYDGSTHSLFLVGDYYYVRELNSEYVIETRLTACASVSCNSAVAIKYKTQVAFIFVNSYGTLNLPTLLGSTNDAGISISSSSTGYTVSTPNGCILTIDATYSAVGNTYILSLSSYIPATFKGQVRGLSCNFDGSTTDDFMFPNGTVTTNIAAFQASWIVPSAQDLFTYSSGYTSDQVTTILNSTSFIPELPGATNNFTTSANVPSCPCTGSSCSPTPTCQSNCSAPPPAQNCTQNCNCTLNTTQILEANETCTNDFISGPLATVCNALGANGVAYYEDCFVEYNLTCSAAAVASALSLYCSQCLALAPNNTVVNSVCGCPNCNLVNGECVNQTCTCTNPCYSGPTCNVDICNPPVIYTISVSGECSSKTISVGGNYFNANSNFNAIVGSTNVACSYSSQFLLTCPFPPSLTGVVTVAIYINGTYFNSTSYTSSNVGCGSCNVVVPPTLTLVPSVGFQVFTVSLSTPVGSNVVVNFTSNCVFLSHCSITFPSGNTSSQVITAFNNAANPATSCLIYANVVSGSCSSATITVTKSNAQSAVALTYGDPHFITWEGLVYSFYGTGDFYFVRQLNGELVVQTRQKPCTPNNPASCNVGVAVYFQGVAFFVTISYNNGVPLIASNGSLSSQGIIFTQSGSVFLLNFPTGFTLSISTINSGGFYFLGIQATASPYYLNQLVGLAGYYNGNPNNVLLLPSGTVTSNITQFVLAWQVGTTDNLFLNGTNAVIPDILGGISSSQISTTYDLSCNTYTVSGDLSNVVSGGSLNFGANVVSVSSGNCTFSSPSLQSSAIAACNPYFNDSVAQCCSNLGLSGDLYYATCLCDYNILGGNGFVTESIEAFYTDCNVAALIQNTNCHPCPLACNLQGTCNNGVCICNAGYQGDDCSQNWNIAPNISSTESSTYGYNCPSTVSITGSGFYSLITCSFNGVVVSASIVSEYQIDCALPSLPSGTTSVSLIVYRNVTASNTYSISLAPSCCVNPCENNGLCTGDRFGNNLTFTCDCLGTGYTGTLCQTYVNPCSPNPCQNGGTCSVTGPTTFSCACSDTGYTGSLCQYRGTCPAVSEGNAYWYRGTTGLTSTGSCNSGYFGSPTRLCQLNGTFGTINNPCAASTGNCPSANYVNAQWSTTPAGTYATGTCNTGYSQSALGAPQRYCKEGGTWADFVGYQCQRNICTQTTVSGSTFPTTYSSTSAVTVTGTCPSGQYGSPTLICNTNGSWSSTVVGTCSSVGTCSEVSDYAHATFPATQGGQTATGSCVTGFATTLGGSPQRVCNPNGTWQSLVAPACFRVAK